MQQKTNVFSVKLVGKATNRPKSYIFPSQMRKKIQTFVSFETLESIKVTPDLSELQKRDFRTLPESNKKSPLE